MIFNTKKIKVNYSFDTQLEKTALNLLKKLLKYGNAYFVGGYPRDILIEKNSNEKYEKRDIDICINLNTQELKQALDLLNFDFKALNESLGVYLVNYNDFEFEIACLRKDISIGDGRRPKKVIFTRSIKSDAKRRDFTINAFYFDPFNMVIYDFYNGYKDIQTKTLRFIGNANKRIREDYIRILRFLKFKNKYNLNYIDKEYELIKKYIKNISTINQDKVREELEEIFCLDNINKNLEEFKKLNIFDVILPEIKKLEETNYKVKDLDVFKEIIAEETFLESKVLFYILEKYVGIEFDDKYDENNIKKYVIDNFGVNIIWSIMFHDLGKIIYDYSEINSDNPFEKHEQASLSIASDIMRRMMFSKKSKEEISYIILNHEKIKKFDELSSSEQKYFLSNRYFLEILIIYLSEIFKSEDNNIIKEDIIEYKIQEIRDLLFMYNHVNNEMKNIIGFLDSNLLNIFNIEKGSPLYYRTIEEIQNSFFEGKIKTRNGVIKFLERKMGVVYK